MSTYIPMGSLQLVYTPTVLPDDMGIPEMYFINPLLREKEKKVKMSFLRKKELTGLSEATCPVHGTLPIDRFQVSKRNGKYYVDHTCLTCKVQRRTKRSKEDKAKSNEKHKKATKRAVKLLGNWYIDRLLVSSGVKRSEITDVMRAKKRMEMTEKRKIDRRAILNKRNEQAQGRTERLEDSYVRTVIKRRKEYDGGEITSEMIIKMRNFLLEEREKGINKRFRPNRK